MMSSIRSLSKLRGELVESGDLLNKQKFDTDRIINQAYTNQSIMRSTERTEKLIRESSKSSKRQSDAREYQLSRPQSRLLKKVMTERSKKILGCYENMVHNPSQKIISKDHPTTFVKEIDSFGEQESKDDSSYTIGGALFNQT